MFAKLIINNHSENSHLSKLKQKLKNASEVDLYQIIFYSVVFQDDFQSSFQAKERKQ